MGDDDPDHGLRYELAAVVGAPMLLTALARALPGARVVSLAVPDLGLVPVIPEMANEITPAALCAPDAESLPGGSTDAAERRAYLLTGPESGFTVLRPGLAALIEAASAEGVLAYVEADYVGREGVQAAAVWRRGHLSIGPLLLGRREEFVPADAPLNLALRTLGVAASGRSDEFTVAGLGRHRRTADWS